MASATSKKTELKLPGVARAGVEGLLLDYGDFLRRQRLRICSGGWPQARVVLGNWAVSV